MECACLCRMMFSYACTWTLCTFTRWWYWNSTYSCPERSRCWQLNLIHITSTDYALYHSHKSRRVSVRCCTLHLQPLNRVLTQHYALACARLVGRVALLEIFAAVMFVCSSAPWCIERAQMRGIWNIYRWNMMKFTQAFVLEQHMNLDIPHQFGLECLLVLMTLPVPVSNSIPGGSFVPGIACTWHIWTFCWSRSLKMIPDTP